MFKHWMTVAVALMLGLCFHHSANALGLGDAAPKIEVKEFVKGEPVKEFEKGKVYVVEFWATWCGPCRVSIPHLTELAKKHKDTTFIGVSVFEHDAEQAQVKPFVTEMGDKMDYHVAMDQIPEGGDGQTGKMATNWMEAAKQPGIPTAFIIDKDAKIAWIGHPSAMEKPLVKIEAGTWDIKTAIAEQAKAEAVQKKMQAFLQKIEKAGDDQAKQLAVVDQTIQSDPDMEAQLATGKLFLLMSPKGDPDKAAAYANHLTTTLYKDNAEQLNALAWNIVDPAKPKQSAKLRATALKAAIRADELEHGKNSAIADTLGKAYFDNGNIAKAVETQTRAVKLAKGTELEKDATLAERLAQYKKAMKK